MNVDSNIINDIITHYRGSTLILYGSRARGTDKKNSDWDILMIDDEIDPLELNSFVNTMESKHSVSLDVKNCTKEQFFKIKKEKTPFYMEVRYSIYDPDECLKSNWSKFSSDFIWNRPVLIRTFFQGS